MRIDYDRHRRRIETMYTDKADIYRYENVRDPDSGADKKELVMKYSEQRCRISQRALATMNQTEAQNNIQYETKLFIAPEVDIQQGDLLQVTRGAVQRKYEAGEPFLYPTHQEISIQRREWA